MTDIFDKTPKYYSKYRLQPPQEVIDVLQKIGDLNGQEILLDVGCGPGTSSLFFSPYFKKIIGLDISNSMIQEAINQATQQGITNIQWMCAPAETVNLQQIGSIDLIIFANSFHWMDQELVMDRFKDIVKKGGAFLGGGSSWNNQQEHDQIIVSTIREFVGKTRKTVQGGYNKPKSTFKELIDNSSFTFIERKLINFTHEFTVEELIGLQLSTSYANENLLGNKKSKFIAVLSDRLNEVSHNGIITSNEIFEVILFSK